MFGTRDRVGRLIRRGRYARAWELLPRLAFRDLLAAVARLDTAGWAPAEPELFARVVPAARLDPLVVAPLLSGAPVPLPDIPPGPSVSALSFAPDAPTLAVVRHGSGIEVWRIGAAEPFRRYAWPDGRNGFGHALCLSRGRVLLSAGPAAGPYRSLVLLDGDAPRELARLTEDIVALLPLPDGAGAALTRRGQLWLHSDDGATYRGAPLDLPTGAVPLWGAASTVDGELIATYSYQTASVHESASGRAISRTGPLAPLDGRREVVVHPSNVLPGLSFTLDAGRIASIAFQPGGAGLVAGTIDGAVRLLGLDFSRQGELQPHRYFPVVHTAGRILVAAKDNAIRVYPWPPARPVLLHPVPEGPVALSPSGWVLAVASGSSANGDQPVALWDLTPLVLADAVRRPVSTVDGQLVQEAGAAAAYRGDPIVTTVLDALLAAVERGGTPSGCCAPGVPPGAYSREGSQ